MREFLDANIIDWRGPPRGFAPRPALRSAERARCDARTPGPQPCRARAASIPGGGPPYGISRSFRADLARSANGAAPAFGLRCRRGRWREADDGCRAVGTGVGATQRMAERPRISSTASWIASPSETRSRSGKRSARRQQGFEAVVHVQLDVAVEQRGAGLVGGEIHRGTTVGGHDDRVLEDARGHAAVDLGDLE